jgi:nicotinamidase/pyrazinamidase
MVVDVQLDFCPGGALPIANGDRVVPVLNRWLKAAGSLDIPVYASRDWHPRRHPSFAGSGGTWPVHCVQDSAGAAFHPDLALPAAAIVVTKGTRFDRDQYSAFDETGLAVELQRRGITRVFVGGLAQDVCVRATVLDACRLGLSVIVIADATLPVTRDGGAAATGEMVDAGAEFVATAS